MSDWRFAEQNPEQHLAELRFFSVKKLQDGQEIEFRITVYEYNTPHDPAARYFAVADKKTNQNDAPFTPSGWGSTLLRALSDCVKAIERFPYQGE